MTAQACDTVAEIKSRLAALHPVHLEVLDDSARHAGHAGARSGGGHYQLHIVSAVFSGQNALARHRSIHAALGDLMQGRIHAISITAQAPGEL
ncbi:MAG: BolA family transcriptional regulator [Betaproteobacteria bacterium]|nr:BolA family transcriptional regulator [Betaproteobacteria bacterium]